MAEDAENQVSLGLGRAVSDLPKKLDMIKERYGDQFVDAVLAEINGRDWQVLDVIGFTLIVSKKNSNVNTTYSSGFITKFTKDNKDFDLSPDLFYAEHDPEIEKVLKRTNREKMQQQDLVSYVERSARKPLNELDQAEMGKILNPFLKRMPQLDLAKFNEFATFLPDSHVKFKIADDEVGRLFRNYYQLLNDAAIVHKLSYDGHAVLGLLDAQFKNFGGRLDEMSQNSQLISEVARSLSETDNAKVYLEGVRDKSIAVEAAMRQLLGNLQSAQGRDNLNAKLNEIVASFRSVEALVSDFYAFILQNEETFEVRVNKSGIKNALDGNVNIISNLLMQGRNIVESILFNHFISVPSINLDGPLFVSLICAVNEALDILLSEGSKDDSFLKNDSNCYVYHGVDNEQSVVYIGDVLAKLVSSASKLFDEVYKGKDINESFGNFKEAIDFIVNLEQEGEGNDRVGEIIKRLKNINKKIDNIEVFCHHLSGYNQSKNALGRDINRYISSQFVTTGKTPIDQAFSRELWNIKMRIDVDFEVALGGYKVPEDFKLDDQTSFLVNIYGGVLNGTNIGIPLRVSKLISKPINKIKEKVTAKAKASSSNSYLCHGVQHPQSGELPMSSSLKEKVDFIFSAQGLDGFVDTCKRDIDGCIATFVNAKRPFIPAWVGKDDLVSSISHNIVLKPGTDNLKMQVLTLRILDVIASDESMIADIRGKKTKKVKKGDDDRNDLASNLLQYVPKLEEIKTHLNEKLSECNRPDASSTIKFGGKNGEDLLSALGRIINGLNKLKAAPSRSKTPQRIATNISLLVRFNNFAQAVNSLREVSEDMRLDVLRNIPKNNLEKIYDELSEGDEIKQMIGTNRLLAED